MKQSISVDGNGESLTVVYEPAPHQRLTIQYASKSRDARLVLPVAETEVAEFLRDLRDE